MVEPPTKSKAKQFQLSAESVGSYTKREIVCAGLS